MNKYLNMWSYINWVGRRVLQFKNKQYSFSRKRDDEQIFWLFGVPEHTNIGDQAIAIAEVEFINKYFPNYKVVLIPENQVSKAIPEVSKIAKSKDIITFHGGGNMGDIYPNQEQLRRQLIRTFNDRKVMFFPQSTMFNKTESLQESIKSYSQNPQLMITFRDKNSYKLGESHFIDNKLALIPDIVLLLADKVIDDIDGRRSGVITLLRQDIEKEDNGNITDVLDFLKKTNVRVDFSDTTAKHINFIPSIFRHRIVSKKLSEIKQHKLAITDRLHGMIFSYITNTPALVFDNNNHKVKYFYDAWFQNINYIELVSPDEDLEDIKFKISKLWNMKEQKNKVNVGAYYTQMVNFLKSK